MRSFILTRRVRVKVERFFKNGANDFDDSMMQYPVSYSSLKDMSKFRVMKIE